VNPLAPLFHERFRGLERAHGTYRLIGKAAQGQKQKGQAVSVREPVTDELWDLHLRGEQGLGVVPINEDGMCLWGAIDVDIKDFPDFRPEDAEQRVKKAELPLVVCRSKSGGGHLCLFLRDLAPAKLVRQRLSEWMLKLGYPGVEVFPKQETRVGEEDVGSWINMPYFGGEATDRYAVCHGTKLSPEAFLEYAATAAVSSGALEALEEEEPEELRGAPPCLKYLARNPEKISARNNFLFSLSVYLVKRYPDDEGPALLNRVMKMNTDILGKQALPFKEVRSTVAKSVDKKRDYFYRCKDEPLVGVCDKTLCRECEFGIGGDGELGLELVDLEAYGKEPTIYHVTINGKRVRLEGSEYLMEQQRFGLKCVEHIKYKPPQLKTPKWDAIVNELLANMVEVEAPEDLSQTGHMWKLVEAYCTGHHVKDNQDDLAGGSAYKDETTIWFHLHELLKFMDKERFPRAFQQGALVTSFLMSKGAQTKNMQALGKNVLVWGIPRKELAEVTEEREVQAIDQPEF
jgi:hypothetical protein